MGFYPRTTNCVDKSTEDDRRGSLDLLLVRTPRGDTSSLKQVCLSRHSSRSSKASSVLKSSNWTSIFGQRFLIAPMNSAINSFASAFEIRFCLRPRYSGSFKYCSLLVP